MLAMQKPDPELLPVHRPRCPQCQKRMITVGIELMSDGFERRRFECRKCGHAETGTVASDPYRSEASRRAFAGLRIPEKQV
jgi:tRNA(Ile2) C34 agmatinyltransferase TiaS